MKFITVDNSGYPLTIEIIGSLTPYECANTSATTGAFTKITAAYLPSGVTVIPSYLFRYCAKLAELNGMNSVTSIETYAFHTCAELELTSLPSGLTTIGSYAFTGCKKINPTIIKVSSVINGNSFQNCTGMTDLEKIQAGNIYSNAFSGCSGLGPKLKIKALQIGTSPTNTNNAFRNCTGLRAVWLDVSTIHAGSATYGPFYGCSNLTIYTPASEKPAGWGNYFNYLGTSSQANVVYNTTEAQFDALQIS